MNRKKIQRYLILGVLFFLPVLFLLLLYPAKHNYTPLDSFENKIVELQNFTALENQNTTLKNHITILGFLGETPELQLVALSNLKELIYDKFKGFKSFQIVLIAPKGTEDKVAAIQKKINSYEAVKYWYYLFGKPNAIKKVYNSLYLNDSLSLKSGISKVVIIDKERHLRGRIDDRTDKEIEQNQPIYPLKAYNCIEVAEIKNKMSDDLRILFTEYRQKRKGTFDSSTRRNHQINTTNEKE